MIATKMFAWRFHFEGKKERALAFFVVATLAAGIILLGIALAMKSFKSNWNERQLTELVESVILRAEFAIDNVILAQVDLLSAGLSNCSPQAMAAVRSAIYRQGALVDIQISGPEGTCQVFQEFGLDLQALDAEDGALAARNSNFKLKPLANETSLGLAVVWDFRSDHTMTAVGRTDALLFDILPAAIRDHTTITLSLDGGTAIAQYPANQGADQITDPANWLDFSNSSERFPITADLSISKAAFDAWHSRVSPAMVFSIIITSVLIGLTVALGLVRAPSERERLGAALRKGQIKPFFQPIISLSTNRVVGCEVLARWIEPDGTIIPPDMFITLAELTDQSDDITRALMRETGRDLGLAIAGNTNFKVNFNITAKQLAKPSFADDFLSYAERCGLTRNQLVVELIERGSEDSLAGAKVALAQLRTRGVRVAIDDVGTGHNGLALLQSLDADVLKIDKLFVDMIEEDDSSRAISEMLVSIARRSNMSLVAEGVERKEQALILQELGITEAQGYFFSKPLPVDEFLTFLESDADAAFTGMNLDEESDACRLGKHPLAKSTNPLAA